MEQLNSYHFILKYDCKFFPNSFILTVTRIYPQIIVQFTVTQYEELVENLIRCFISRVPFPVTLTIKINFHT